MKCALPFLLMLLSFGGFSQDQNPNYRTKKMAVKDSILVDDVSINSSWFSVMTKNGRVLDTSFYDINFPKALLTFKKNVDTDSILVNYLKFPEFLTKTYKQLDDSIIVANNASVRKVYQLTQPNTTKTFTPFNGLSTSGSISRGITVGNNQNSVLNSELDLQITGKLNDKVSLRASIQDANIPLQESGYSQRLDEFDQVFVELFSDTWNIRAGDIDLLNNNSYFASFSKRVQGLSAKVNLNGNTSETQVFAAGALVRGQFATSQFSAQEGNQGPYKIQGPNGELFVLLVSGSETVYVNGISLERGEDKDYIIDYNAGEIIFNTTFPITSEMRVLVDYQFSDRNYSRLVAFGGGNYSSDKLKIGISVYSENDAKNQPLQQNLSETQVQILANAGDDRAQMIAPSEIEETYSENQILYRKELVNGEEVFVFSNNPDDALFRVTFTRVGTGQGNYRLRNTTTNTIAAIYEYAGPLQGDFAPVVQLIAPTKLQVAVVNGSYTPNEKSTINFELAGSKNDLNLFSNADDANNDGFAGHVDATKTLIKTDSLWNLNAYINSDYVHANFRNLEGLYNAEFNRDWNIDQPASNQIITGLGNQTLFYSGIKLFHPKKGSIDYRFEHLNFSLGYNGNRHLANVNIQLKKLGINSMNSILKSHATLSNSTFFRSHNSLTYRYKKGWLGGKLSFENNQKTEKNTNILDPVSQRFSSYEIFTGLGDSTQVYAQIGYKIRVNDSIKNNQLQKVNTSNTLYFDSRLIKSSTSNLSVFANYRRLSYVDQSVENENSLNSRIQFNQNLLKTIVQSNTVYETNSGYLPQQDFTYVAVEPGRGNYTWIDYNNNNIQELEEFEIAQFQDQGTYIRVLLPNRVFIKTHQNRFSQTLTINPSQWRVSKQKSQQFWSLFYNQTSYLVDRKNRRSGSDYNLNPFVGKGENEIGLQLNFRNVLFFNRGKQRYTTSYTYLSNKNNNTLSVGLLENNLRSHQLNFNHKIKEHWLITLQSALGTNENSSENFTSKNFKFDEASLNPKLSYLFNENSRFDLFYQFTSKQNTIGGLESLKQQNFGIGLSVTKNEKSAITSEVNYFSNAYTGGTNTPVAFQMLEGLQPGNNFTWTLLAQKKLTKFLDLNLSYFGRKSETSKTIHTGNIQLKAYF